MPHHIMIMLAAGMAVPVLAALNAALGRTIGSPAIAAAVLFAVALLTALVVLAITKPDWTTLAAPPHLFLGGALIAFYVLSITWIAPVMGVGNAVFLVLIGQLISSAAIDHFGLFSAQVTALTPQRLAGIALMAAGVFVAQRA